MFQGWETLNMASFSARRVVSVSNKTRFQQQHSDSGVRIWCRRENKDPSGTVVAAGSGAGDVSHFVPLVPTR